MLSDNDRRWAIAKALGWFANNHVSNVVQRAVDQGADAESAVESTLRSGGYSGQGRSLLVVKDGLRVQHGDDLGVVPWSDIVAAAMGQDTLFGRIEEPVADPPPMADGERLKAEGIARVTLNEDDFWKQAFRDAVLLLEPGDEFTSETITNEVGMPPHHPNAVGAQMNALARQAHIELVKFVKAKKKNQHATRVGVWRRV